jgi:hypothetical protein
MNADLSLYVHRHIGSGSLYPYINFEHLQVTETILRYMIFACAMDHTATGFQKKNG